TFVSDPTEQYVEVKNVTKTHFQNLDQSQIEHWKLQKLPQENIYFLAFEITSFGSGLYIPNKVSNRKKDGFYFSVKLVGDEYNTNILSSVSGHIYSTIPISQTVYDSSYYFVSERNTTVFYLIVNAVGEDSQNLNIQLTSFWCSKHFLSIEDGHRYEIGKPFAFERVSL
ncbi:MAG TPA: hypothetical protein PKE08_02960, partial [Candidatus Paceibacterota bacterium]|nr:hypothetical protein [Candidatus Paceibacterota bacterium]